MERYCRHCGLEVGIGIEDLPACPHCDRRRAANPPKFCPYCGIHLGFYDERLNPSCANEQCPRVGRPLLFLVPITPDLFAVR
jgi:hypothetical protein